MMKCSLCGNLIEDTDYFCEKCGYPNRRAFSAKKSQQKAQQSGSRAQTAQHAQKSFEKNKAHRNPVGSGEMKKFCGKCGKQIDVNAQFCTSCGPAVEATEVEAASKTPRQQRQAMQPEQPQRQPAVLQEAAWEAQPAAAPAPTPLQPTEPAQAVRNVPSAANYESYRQLGGFLKFVVILYKFIGPISLLFTVVTYSIPIIQSLVFYQQYKQYDYYGQAGSLMAWSITSWILGIVIAIFACVVCVKFAKKIEKRDSKFLRYFQLIWLITECALAIQLFITTDGDFWQRLITSLINLMIDTGVLVVWNLYYVKSVRVCVYMGSDEYLRNSIFNKKTKAPVRFEQTNQAPVDVQGQEQVPVSAQWQPQVPENPQQGQQREAALRCERCGQTIDAYPCRFCGNTPPRPQAQKRERITYNGK